MIAFIYIPILLIAQFIGMWLAYKTNSNPRWFYVGCAFSIFCCWVWPMVTVYSKNILFDAILYDITVCLTCAAFGIYLADQSIYFSRTEIIGVIISVAGLIIFKVGAIVK